MLVQSAEESFQQGRKSLSSGRYREALAMFEAAIRLEQRFSRERPQARYLSYYGLVLGLERRETREALRFCREAVALESYNPDLRCNLGQVLLRAGRRREAYQSFQRGLSLQADHPGLLRAVRRLGVRRRPVLSFLPRNNVLNVVLGKMRAPGRTASKRQAVTLLRQG
jgi:tetratricopeptide (TPR) repeat protein